MAIQESKNVKITEKVKVGSFLVLEVESDAVIVMVEGWRMRVYFDNKEQVLLPSVGKYIEVKYTGNIKNPHTVKFEKIK